VLLGAVILGGGVATAAVVVQHKSTASPEAQMRQAMAASSRALRTLPACRGAKQRRVRLVDEPVPTWLSDHLGILRRPQTAADRARDVTLRYAVGSVILRASRRLAVQPDGWSYRFALMRGTGSFYAAQSDPVACAEGRRAVALAAAASFPAAVQKAVRREVDGELAAVRDAASGRTLEYQITEFRPDGLTTSSGGGSLDPARPLPASAGIGTYAHGDVRGHSVSALVPDGVATIRILDTSGSPRERPRTVKVVDNFFHTILPRRFGPTMVLQWRAPSGRVVRTTHLHY
jgi:hypothetical protein